MHLSILHHCTFLKQLSAAGFFLQTLTELLSAETHPGSGAPGSPALFFHVLQEVAFEVMEV